MYPVDRGLILNELGADVTWKVRRNCPWQTEGQITDCGKAVPLPDGTPVTAGIFSGSEEGATPLRTFTCTTLDQVNGVWRIRIAENNATLPVGIYWWAMQIDYGLGNEPVASGPFVVEPWVLTP